MRIPWWSGLILLIVLEGATLLLAYRNWSDTGRTA